MGRILNRFSRDQAEPKPNPNPNSNPKSNPRSNRRPGCDETVNMLSSPTHLTHSYYPYNPYNSYSIFNRDPNPNPQFPALNLAKESLDTQLPRAVTSWLRSASQVLPLTLPLAQTSTKKLDVTLPLTLLCPGSNRTPASRSRSVPNLRGGACMPSSRSRSVPNLDTGGARRPIGHTWEGCMHNWHI